MCISSKSYKNIDALIIAKLLLKSSHVAGNKEKLILMLDNSAYFEVFMTYLFPLNGIAILCTCYLKTEINLLIIVTKCKYR